VKKHRMPNLWGAARNAMCESPMTGDQGPRAATNYPGVSFLHQKIAPNDPSHWSAGPTGLDVLNPTDFEAGIFRASPVLGLRPSRAGRSLTENLPILAIDRAGRLPNGSQYQTPLRRIHQSGRRILKCVAGEVNPEKRNKRRTPATTGT
jgi:hypothetical protein